MNAEHAAREIGEGPSCSCGCERCGRDIHALYRIALDQSAWIKHVEGELTSLRARYGVGVVTRLWTCGACRFTFDTINEPKDAKITCPKCALARLGVAS